MSDSPFFQFYPSDWLAGTRGLTASETGVYITLVAMMYETEGAIPNDPKRLARLCGSTLAAFKKAIDGLISTGKLSLDDDGFSNGRVEIEIQKRAEKRAAASQSASARWDKTKQNQSTKNANASEPQCESNANQKPEARIKKEELNSSSKKRGSRLSENWVLPRDWGDWAEAEGFAEAAIRIEAEKFKDYWIAKAGKEASKLDWQATWRNWVRTALSRSGRSAGNASGDGGKSRAQRWSMLGRAAA